MKRHFVATLSVAHWNSIGGSLWIINRLVAIGQTPRTARSAVRAEAILTRDNRNSRSDRFINLTRVLYASTEFGQSGDLCPPDPYWFNHIRQFFCAPHACQLIFHFLPRIVESRTRWSRWRERWLIALIVVWPDDQSCYSILRTLIK